MRPQWRAPLGFSKIDRHRQTLKLCRKKAPVAGHHRSACSGVKALRNTSDARRQAAKLCYRFGPLTPSARSANLIAGDGTKNGFPAPNKEPAKTKNHHLTGKAPYKSMAVVPTGTHHLSEISSQVAADAHAVVILDGFIAAVLQIGMISAAALPSDGQAAP